MSDNKEIAGRAGEDQMGQGMTGGAVPSAAGMMGVVQGMMGAMQNAAGQAGSGGATYMPMAPGNLMQSSMMTSGGDASTAVGADPNAHTSQTYDPTTNTLITTTVDPTTGATTTTMTSSHTTGGTAMASSRAIGGPGAEAVDPPQTARVTEVVDDDDDMGDQEDDPDT